MTTNNGFSLAEIFQSGMVLQRNKEIKIWGQAPAGCQISASIYMADSKITKKTSAISSQDGGFMLVFPALEAAENVELKISCDAPNTAAIELFNISIGDIWLAGGQSNMEFFLKFDQDWEEVKTWPKNSKIHMYNQPQVAFCGHSTHNRGGYGYWLTEGDDGFEKFSAPAYSFARHIQPEVGVPIGIIGCNWGGSTASAWVPEQVLSVPPLDNYFKEYQEAIQGKTAEELRQESLKGWAFEDSLSHGKDFEPFLYGRDRMWQLNYMKKHANDPVIPMGPYNLNRPSGLYHNMLKKLIPFSIKGVLWYQGESDAGNRAWMYDQLLTALIMDWRSEWQDDFPFIMVQLAPFGKWLDCGNEEYTVVRQMQEKVASTVENTYMASIMDIGNYYDIHPKAKLEVGRRLALLALGHVYGRNILCDSPSFKSGVRQDNTIIVEFNNSDGLTITDGGSDILCHFTNDSGEDLALKPADVSVKNDRLYIELPANAPVGPVTLTLGWGDFAQIFIHNSQGLPVAPFSTNID